MNRIRILSEHTINKIAAGEVIENTASVVKELVENSLDAGATEIEIEIRGGGRQLIRVSDNGCGMDRDDALLCFERHATSKLKELEDLQTIETMGFRGEAIPSIASISKLTLLTCPHGKETGTLVKVEGGHIKQIVSAPCSQGSTFEVKDLFYNVPVRKNFQRSPAYDVQEIHKMLTKISLAHPECRFSLISNQEVLLSAKRDDLRGRIEEVLGKEFCQALKETKISEGIALQGFFGEPAWSRQNRSGQYLFINKRAVVNSLVSYALQEGYGPSLPPQRYPIYVLHLTLPGHLVDVNVHPQKKEVRLRQEQELKNLLIKGVQKTLQTIPKQEIENCLSIPISYPSFRPSSYEFEFREMAPQSVQEELFSAVPTPKNPPKVLATFNGYLLIEKDEGFFFVDQKRAHSRVIFEQLIKQKGKIPQQPLLIPFTLETSPVDADLLRNLTEQFEQLGITVREFRPQTFTVEALPINFGNIDVEQLIYDLMERIREFHDPEAFKREQEILIAQAASRAAVNAKKRMSKEEAQTLIEKWDACDEPFLCPRRKNVLAPFKQEEISKWF